MISVGSIGIGSKFAVDFIISGLTDVYSGIRNIS